MRKIVLAAVLPLLFAVGYGMTALTPVVDAAPAKNLLVYPKNTDTKVIKEDMKKISKALGVQCDYCHDLAAMDKDTDMKTKGREMMKIAISLNAQMKKAGFKQQVTCNTCHAGQKKPKD
jgi:hypothetical protein